MVILNIVYFLFLEVLDKKKDKDGKINLILHKTLILIT